MTEPVTIKAATAECVKAAPGAFDAAPAAWTTLAPSHKREYVDWIAQARKPDTRHRRILRMIDMLNGTP